MDAISTVSITSGEATITKIADRSLEELHGEEKKVPHQWGEVIVLVGSSTAGKSSIIAELLKQKNDFIEDGGDLASVRIPWTFAQKNHSVELAFMRQVIQSSEKLEKDQWRILDYVFGNEKPIFKEGVTENEKTRFSELVEVVKQSIYKNIPPERGIDNFMMDEVLTKAKSGRPVVFDLLQVKDIFNHALGKEHPSLKIALVYCPFQTLAERVVRRNAEALKIDNFDDVRPRVFPLEQFSRLFRPKREENEIVVQRLSRKEAETAFDLAFEDGKIFMITHDPERLAGRDLDKEKIEKKAKILKKLGFAEGDAQDKVVEITPRFKGYQVLINTARIDKTKGEAVRESVTDILFKS